MAVVPVVLFHAGLAPFSGGFVGVDVFFVISGFLITSLIIEESREGRFTLANFYERRARRILPALFLVVACCIPLALLWMVPEDLISFGESVAAVALFISNFHFLSETGYFGTAAEESPLLHTWSLAIEEQYYLLAPILTVALLRRGLRTLGIATAALWAVSLALSAWSSHSFPVASFFLTSSRVWELMSGALLAVSVADHDWTARIPRPAHELLGVAGVGLIAFAIFSFDSTTPFPGLYALVPVAGTVLVIAFASQSTLTGRLLGLGPVVGIGLISYSLYLWHQPLLAFARLRSLQPPTTAELVALIALTVLLAFLSWRFVEVPFRNRSCLRRQTVFRLSAAGAGTCAVLWLSFTLSNGLPIRLDERALAALDIEHGSAPDCGGTLTAEGDLAPSCLSGDGTSPSLAVIGDSHAWRFVPAIGGQLGQTGRAAADLTSPGCPPILGARRIGRTASRNCNEINESIYRHIANDPDIRTVVLAAKWSIYLESTRFDNGEGGREPGKPIYLSSSGTWESDPELRKAQLGALIRSTVTRYLDLGRRVAIVYPVPEVGWDVPMMLARRLSLGGEGRALVTTSYQAYRSRNEAIRQILDSLGDRPGLSRIYPDRSLCNTLLEGRCIADLHGRPLYVDDDHLSRRGARLVIEDFSDVFELGI